MAAKKSSIISAKTGRPYKSRPSSPNIYLKLFDEFPALIWRSGVDAKCDYFNKSWLRFTGRSMEQEAGEGWAEGVHPEDLERCLKTYMDAFHERRPFEMEYRLRRHDGAYRWIVDFGQPYHDLEGNFAGFLGSCYDVTARIRAEERMRRHSLHLQTMNEISAELAKVKLEERTILQAVVQKMAAAIGDACAINLLSPDRQWLITAAFHHRNPDAHAFTRQILSGQRHAVSEGVAGQVLQTGKTALIPVVSPEQIHAAIKPEYRPYIDRVGISSVLVVPLHADGGMIGTLGLTRDQPGSPYDEDDRVLVEELASQIALAIENARLYESSQRELAERKRVEAKNDQLASIVESSNDAIISWSVDDLRISSWNPGATRVYGYSAEEATGRILTMILPPVYQEEIAAMIAKARQGERIEHLETKRVRKDGKVIDISLTLSPLKDSTGNITAFSAIARDISERKQAEEQLRNHYAHLQTAIEQERARIAREMHDELGQALTVMKMDVAGIASDIPPRYQDLRGKAQTITASLDDMIKRVQRISSELRPSMLDDLGLSAALEWQIKEFCGRTGIEYELFCSPEEIVIDNERSTLVFRLFQEALTNIMRHAQATRIRVTLTQTDHKLVLRVRDNGRGITSKQIANPRSFGLIGMRERIHHWRGKIMIKGRLGKGTVLIASVPLSKPAL